MFLIGKINPAKLLNFPEIDVFVLVACPENSLLDSKVLFKPVVSETETAGQMGVDVWMWWHRHVRTERKISFATCDRRELTAISHLP